MDTIINISRNRNTYVIDLDTGKHITAYLEEPFRIVGVSGKAWRGEWCPSHAFVSFQRIYNIQRRPGAKIYYSFNQKST